MANYYANVMGADGGMIGQTEVVDTIPECRALVKEFIDCFPIPEFYTIYELYMAEGHEIDDPVECMPMDALDEETIIHDQLVLGQRAMSLLGRLTTFVINHEEDEDPEMKGRVKMAVEVLKTLEVE